MHKRFFWARGIALLVDGTIYTVAAGIIATVLVLFIPASVSIPSIFNIKGCSALPVTRDDPVIVALQTPADAQIFRRNCWVRQMGINRVNTVITGYSRLTDGRRENRFVGYSADAQGNAVPLIRLDIPAALLFPIIVALFLSRRGTTPGKAMFHLAIENGAGAKPTFKRALARETIKLAPTLLLALSQIPALWETDPVELAKTVAAVDTSAPDFWFRNLSVPVGLSLVVFWFVFGSFIIWRGQAYWDRLTTLYVIDVRNVSSTSIFGPNPNFGKKR